VRWINDSINRCDDLNPWGQMRDPLAYDVRCLGASQLSTYGSRHEHLFEQSR
jgi:hypothetical protein